MFSLLYFGVKAQQYFISLSCVSLDKKALLKTLLYTGLKLNIFRGTTPWANSPDKLDKWFHIQNSQR